MRKLIIGIAIISSVLVTPSFAASAVMNTNTDTQVRYFDGDLNFGLASYSTDQGRVYRSPLDNAMPSKPCCPPPSQPPQPKGCGGCGSYSA